MIFRWLVLLAIGAVAIYWLRTPEAPATTLPAASAPVVLYSLTTCSACRALKAEMLGAKLPFTEHYVDTDPQADQRLKARLIETNIRSRVIGFPVVDVGSELLINGPSLAAILAKAPPRGKGFTGLWRAIERGEVQLP